MIADDMGFAPDDLASGIVVASISGILSHILGGPAVEHREEAVDLAIAFLAAGMERLRDSLAIDSPMDWV